MAFWRKNVAESEPVEARKGADLRIAPPREVKPEGDVSSKESKTPSLVVLSRSEESQPPSLIKEPAPRKPRVVVARGISLSAQLYFDNPTIIEGRLGGSLVSTSSVHVNADSVVRANLSVGSLVVEGRIFGDVRANEKVEIREGGVIEGSVRTPSLEVKDGGILSGPCQIAI